MIILENAKLQSSLLHKNIIKKKKNTLEYKNAINLYDYFWFLSKSINRTIYKEYI